MQAGDDSFERLREAIDGLAAEDVAELLAEARIEARSRVRSMLAEAMAQAMLERARAELDSSPVQREAGPPPVRGDDPVAAPSAPPPVAGLGWYVYCVTEPKGQPIEGLAGIDPSHAVTTLAHGSLEAVVSQVPLDEFGESELRERLADMAWLEQTARRHEAVLDGVGKLRTLVPMRLCSIYREQSGVRTMLEREQEPMKSALDRVRGRREWGVKVFVSGPVLDPPEEASGEDAGGAGTSYMERRRREHSERRHAGERIEQACEVIHDRLSEVAVAGKLVAPQRPEVSGYPGDMILNGAYLVADAETRRFHGVVEALGQDLAGLGLELEPTGPWPAYNFIPGTIGATW
jgi:hypothetical protein